MKQKHLLFPHEPFSGNDVMIDYLEDNRRRLKRSLIGVDVDSLYWQPAPGSNSMAVTIWHMGRLFDVFLTQLVQGQPAAAERWFGAGWVDKTGYDPTGLGKNGWGTLNGYNAADLAAIPNLTREQLIAYLDEVYDAVKQFISSTPMTALTQPAPGFGGQFTQYQVLSMALLDNIRHLGEIHALQAALSQHRRE